MTEELALQAARLVQAFTNAGARIATAESCTGGLIAATITGVPGSSAVFDRAFVTYSNAAKTDLLGVSAALIAADGAVSKSVACRMAEGALATSAADVAIAVTGIAGPGGGSAEKPVGLVHMAVASRNATRHVALHFGDLGREMVRERSVFVAFDMLQAWLTRHGVDVASAGAP